MKEVRHRFLKKLKILQKLVHIMITENISCNLRRFVLSAVSNEVNTLHNMNLHNLGCVFRDVWLMDVSGGKEYWNIREASLTSSLTNSSGRGCWEVSPKGKNSTVFDFLLLFLIIKRKIRCRR